MGLGLFIVRDYIQKLGGTIDALSEKGKGTTFVYSLPLHPDQTALVKNAPFGGENRRSGCARPKTPTQPVGTSNRRRKKTCLHQYSRFLHNFPVGMPSHSSSPTALGISQELVSIPGGKRNAGQSILAAKITCLHAQRLHSTFLRGWHLTHGLCGLEFLWKDTFCHFPVSLCSLCLHPYARPISPEISPRFVDNFLLLFQQIGAVMLFSSLIQPSGRLTKLCQSHRFKYKLK